MNKLVSKNIHQRLNTPWPINNIFTGRTSDANVSQHLIAIDKLRERKKMHNIPSSVM